MVARKRISEELPPRPEGKSPPITTFSMKGGKCAKWYGSHGGYTEDHPLWKEAYKHRILKLADVREDENYGGYEDLKSLVIRYLKSCTDPSKRNDLTAFNTWNMEQVYKKNKVNTTKQKLRKKLTDMKRERRERYEEFVKEIIDEYITYTNQKENEEDKEKKRDKDKNSPSENDSDED